MLVVMCNLGNIDKIVEVIKSNDKQFFFIPWVGKNYEKGMFDKRILVVGASHYCLHTNKCYRPTNNEGCPSLIDGKCNKGCQYFKDCTVQHTKEYNDKCEWMDKGHSCLYDEICRIIDAKIENVNEKISKKLNSSTLDEVCNFLDPSCSDNVSFEKFTKYLIYYLKKRIKKCTKEYDVQSKSVIWNRIAFANYAQNFQPSSTGNNFQPNDFIAFQSYINILKPDVVIVWGCALGGELEKKGCKVNAKEYGYIWTNQTFNNVVFLNSYHPSYSGFEDGGRLDSAMDKVFK